MTFAKPAITVIVSLLLTSIAAAAEIRGVPKILDGDTVEIGDKRIRIFGIDAPEMEQLCLDAAAQRSTCGLSARNALSSFGARRSWSCTSVDVDQYGRHVARCQVEGQDVGRWMVAQGWRSPSSAIPLLMSKTRKRLAPPGAGSGVAPLSPRGTGAPAVPTL